MKAGVETFLIMKEKEFYKHVVSNKTVVCTLGEVVN